MNGIMLLKKRILDPLLNLSKGKIGILVFYLAFSAIYLFRFYYSTMFTSLNEKPLFLAYPYYAGLLVVIAFAGLTILDELQNDHRVAFFLAGIIAIGVLSSLGSKKADIILPMCLLIVASKGRNVRPIFLLSVILGSGFLLIAYYASMNGYIPYLVYERGNSDMLAHAFGMSYRTFLGGQVMYIIMYYAIVRDKKLHLWEYLMLIFDMWIVWRYAMTRTACICMALFLLLTGIELIYFHIKGKWIPVPKCTALVHILCAAFSFAAVAWWGITKGITNIASDYDSLTARLSLSVQAFSEYPVKLFGQMIEQRGGGGIVDTSIPYFVIDIFYVRILLMGGIALFLVYLCLMTYASYKAAKEGQVILAIALMMVAIHSLAEIFAFRLSYNVLILYSLGYFGTKSNSAGKGFIENDNSQGKACEQLS